MSQTFNVTSCRACPLLSVNPGNDGDGGDAPADYTCKHPQGGVVGHMSGSVLDGTPPPAGCPLWVGDLRVKLCASLFKDRWRGGAS